MAAAGVADGVNHKQIQPWSASGALAVQTASAGGAAAAAGGDGVESQQKQPLGQQVASEQQGLVKRLKLKVIRKSPSSGTLGLVLKGGTDSERSEGQQQHQGASDRDAYSDGTAPNGR